MKQLTAQNLFEILNEMKIDGYDLDRITISYRYDTDSDYEAITYVSEGCYDAETNNILEELVFLTDASEYED